MDLVRLAMPRRVYTQSHADYVVEVFEEVARRREQLRGLRIVVAAAAAAALHREVSSRWAEQGGAAALSRALARRQSSDEACKGRRDCATRDDGVDQLEATAPRHRAFQCHGEFAPAVHPHAFPAERGRAAGEIPVVQFVELRARLEEPQHLPAAIVEDDDDRIPAVAPAVAEFPAGHLEGAVSHDDQRPSPRGRLQAQSGRHAVTHRGVVTGCDHLGMTDVERGEHAVAHVGGDRHCAVSCKRCVDCRRNVRWRDRRIVRNERRGRAGLELRQLVSLAGLAVEAREQSLDDCRKRHVGIAVVADAHCAVVRQDRGARRDRVRGYAEVRVARSDAEQQQAIGILDEICDRGIARRAEVGAH